MVLGFLNMTMGSIMATLFCCNTHLIRLGNSKGGLTRQRWILGRLVVPGYYGCSMR